MQTPTHTQDPDTATTARVDDLPPSAKLVYKVLEYEGELTQEEIATESRLCARTVRYALGQLERNALVDSRVSLEDARQSIYRIPELELESGSGSGSGSEPE